MGGVSLIILIVVIILAVIGAVVLLVGHGVFQGVRSSGRRSRDEDERPRHTEVAGERFGPHPEAERAPR